MQDLTLAHAAAICRDIRRTTFCLTTGQLRTLDSLDLDPATKDLLRKVNGMNIPRSPCHDLGSRLQTLAAMPPSAAGAQPDWKTWWLDRRNELLGCPREPDPAADPMSVPLAHAITAMAYQALPHLPDYRETALHIMHQGEEPARVRGPQNLGIDLTQVIIAVTRVRRNAIHLGLSPGDLENTPSAPATPESVTETLRDLPVQPDMGTITDVPSMLDPVQRYGIDGISAYATSRLWHRTGVKDSYLLLSHVVAPPGAGATLDPERLEALSPGPAQHRLAVMTAPADPALTDFQTNNEHPQAHAIARLTGTVPAQVLAYLSGTGPEPEKPAPRPCPQAHRCPSRCAALQHTGERQFPLTHDGQHENCALWAFLQARQEDQEAVREMAAQDLLARGNPRARRPQRPQPTPTEPEPAHGPNQPPGKTREPTVAQPALF